GQRSGHGVRHTRTAVVHLGRDDVGGGRPRPHGHAGRSWDPLTGRRGRSTDRRREPSQQPCHPRRLVPPFARQFLSLPEYPLASIPQRKRDLLARGIDVIDLGAGDADLAPPEAALTRMAQAVLEPQFSRYGFGMGYVPY